MLDSGFWILDIGYSILDARLLETSILTDKIADDKVQAAFRRNLTARSPKDDRKID